VTDHTMTTSLRPDPLTVGPEYAARIREAVGRHDACRPLRVTKRGLQLVGQCERSWLVELDTPFPGWSPRLAAGTVIHEAIRLHLGTRPHHLEPEHIVRGALQRLRSQRSSLARWLDEADPLDLAELRLQAVDTVARFQADFPPLDPVLTVRADPKVEVTLGANVILVSKPDLVLGSPRRTPEGLAAEAIGVEFKTGNMWPAAAAAELNLHSVCETLRYGAPLAMHYRWNLTTGHIVGTPVDPDTLAAYATGLGQTIFRMTALLEDRPTDVNQGWWCQWCPGMAQCDVGAEDGDHA